VRPPAKIDVFRAIADPSRRRILELLAPGETAYSDLALEFPTSKSAVSQHLRVLQEVGLVRERQVGRARSYSLFPAPLGGVMKWVRAIAAIQDPMSHAWALYEVGNQISARASARPKRRRKK
jgi:DNA-binding transcriptional ArsR family regulator